MALQIWTTRCMKIPSRQKINRLPHLLGCHSSRFLTMLIKDHGVSMHDIISRPLHRDYYVPTSVIYKRSNRRNSQQFSYEIQSSFHTNACCYCQNKNMQDINKVSGIDASVQTEHADITAINVSSQTPFSEDTDSEDMNIKPSLDSIKPSVPPPMHVEIVPGKGPPPEPPVDCCMSGCANCVWIQYAEELKQYFSKDSGLERVKSDIEKIDNPGLKMFLKLELGLL